VTAQRILVIEDDLDIANVLKMDLGDAGFTVEHADSAMNGLIKARRVGTGFLLVRGDVFRRMAAEGLAPEYKTRDGAKGDLTMRRWFWFDVDADGYDVGEDYYFCNQAKKLGYESWCDPDVRLSHFEGLVEHTLCLADIMTAMETVDGNAV
jgi:CheY-like chemotaxis protein